MDVYAPRGQTYSKRKDKFMDTMNSAIYIENDRLFDYAAAAARLTSACSFILAVYSMVLSHHVCVS